MVMEERLGFWAPGSWGVRDRGIGILGRGGGGRARSSDHWVLWKKAAGGSDSLL